MFFNQKTTTFTIVVTNVAQNKGNVMIAVHNRSNFLKTRIVEKALPAAGTSVNVNIELAQGEYAVAVFQDKNNNQYLDTNFVGIPQESYGFSNNARPKFRAPTFDEAKIILTEQAKTIQVSLQSW